MIFSFLLILILTPFVWALPVPNTEYSPDKSDGLTRNKRLVVMNKDLQNTEDAWADFHNMPYLGRVTAHYTGINYKEHCNAVQITPTHFLTLGSCLLSIPGESVNFIKVSLPSKQGWMETDAIRYIIHPDRVMAAQTKIYLLSNNAEEYDFDLGLIEIAPFEHLEGHEKRLTINMAPDAQSLYPKPIASTVNVRTDSLAATRYTMYWVDDDKRKRDRNQQFAVTFPGYTDLSDKGSPLIGRTGQQDILLGVLIRWAKTKVVDSDKTYDEYRSYYSRSDKTIDFLKDNLVVSRNLTSADVFGDKVESPDDIVAVEFQDSALNLEKWTSVNLHTETTPLHSTTRSPISGTASASLSATQEKSKISNLSSNTKEFSLWFSILKILSWI